MVKGNARDLEPSNRYIGKPSMETKLQNRSPFSKPKQLSQFASKTKITIIFRQALIASRKILYCTVLLVDVLNHYFEVTKLSPTTVYRPVWYSMKQDVQSPLVNCEQYRVWFWACKRFMLNGK